jgi:hypothetical protein
MAKKIFLALFVAAFATGGLFAQIQFSAGGGGLLGGDFGGGISATAGGVELEQPLSYFGGGFYAFLDATYAEVSLGIFSPTGRWELTTKNYPANKPDFSVDAQYQMLTLGFLVKYPIGINESISVFPLAGIDYRIVNGLKADNGTKKYAGDTSDFTALWFIGGIGMDFSLPVSAPIYLRLEALYGIRLANKYEDDSVKSWDEVFKVIGGEAQALMGHGLTAKLAVGYKF